MDVEAWLRSLGLGEHYGAFADNDIDGDTLIELTADDLKEIGIASVGQRRKLLNAIARLAGPHSKPETSLQSDAGQISEPAGERRQVTVLFADIAGYTKLSSELGSEETHALLNRYFEAVDAIVENYGGSVDKHMGDNVMAVFGAPIAHDDDPLRAVRAALEQTPLKFGHIQHG